MCTKQSQGSSFGPPMDSRVLNSLQPDWQIDNGFFNRPIMAHTQIVVHRKGPRIKIWCCFIDVTAGTAVSGVNFCLWCTLANRLFHHFLTFEWHQLAKKSIDMAGKNTVKSDVLKFPELKSRNTCMYMCMPTTVSSKVATSCSKPCESTDMYRVC